MPDLVTAPDPATAKNPDPPAPSTAGPTRVLRGILGLLIVLLPVADAVRLFRWLDWRILPEQLLVLVLGIALALVFLLVPARRAGAPRRTPVPLHDGVLAGLALAAAIWHANAYPRLMDVFLVEKPVDGLIVSSLLIFLAMEGLRRTAGHALVAIVLAFGLHAMIGHRMPGDLQTRDIAPDDLLIYLGVDASAMFGLVMGVAVMVVVPFILFGQLLSASGAAAFFNDLSLALMGKYRGGAAKISVLASALFGSVSGVVVSNIMATGVITIPLMRRAGFSGHQAAAIEATASTGGQLMPPVMGAVAFLMADFLQITYGEVVVAALVPSALYYIALFIQADLQAARQEILGLPDDQIPPLGAVLRKGWPFIIPFAVLFWGLFVGNLAAQEAALWACLSLVVLGLTLGYGGQRMSLRALFAAIVDAGVGAKEILLIGAAAGLIMGVLQITGLGFALTLMLVDMGGGNLVLLLLVAALLCIVLGMGMPTLGVYVLLAVLVAPSLVEVGIPPLAAHMFILYLGMMSFLTPPVAIAAFFAAGIAQAPPMMTGFTALRFGWAAYVVPFLFVFSPALLLQDPSWLHTALVLVSAVAGVFLISVGVTGHWLRPLRLPRRVLFIAAGAALLTPADLAEWGPWSDMLGAMAGAMLVTAEVVGRRRNRALAG